VFLIHAVSLRWSLAGHRHRERRTIVVEEFFSPGSQSLEYADGVIAPTLE
jgi:hypothetical protein